MAVLKFFIYLMIMLVVIVLGLLFSFRNQSLVTVDFIFFSLPPLSVGFWILSTLIIGVLIGVALTYPRKLFQSIRIKYLSKKISDTKPSLAPQSKAELNKGH